MTNAQERSSINWLIWLAVVVLLAVGISANYWYAAALSFAVRLAIGIVYCIAIAFVALYTQEGRRFWQFAQDARVELRKVVWPNRRETIQTTLLVVVMVVVTSLALWGIDSLLTLFVNWVTG